MLVKMGEYGGGGEAGGLRASFPPIHMVGSCESVGPGPASRLTTLWGHGHNLAKCMCFTP